MVILLGFHASFSDEDWYGVTFIVNYPGWTYDIVYSCYNGYYSVHVLSLDGEGDEMLPGVDGTRSMGLGPYPSPMIIAAFLMATEA